jgi:transposase
MVNMPDVPSVSEGTTIGIDIGQNSCISVSNGQVVECDPHGHTYASICKELARKKRGSKAFSRKQKHRENFIHYCVNQINFDGVKNMRIEKIRQLRTGVRTSRLLSGWSYKEVFDALRGKVETLGVQVTELSPTYTSQRCSKCGRVRKANRKGKVYTCDHCGLTMDADVNAAINISLLLPEIPKEVRLKGLNKTGFFWNLSGISLDCHEPIVRDALKTNLRANYNVC